MEWTIIPGCYMIWTILPLHSVYKDHEHCFSVIISTNVMSCTDRYSMRNYGKKTLYEKEKKMSRQKRQSPLVFWKTSVKFPRLVYFLVDSFCLFDLFIYCISFRFRSRESLEYFGLIDFHTSPLKCSFNLLSQSFACEINLRLMSPLMSG